MDADRFDELTKRLAGAGASRRRLLQGLGAAILAAVGRAADVRAEAGRNNVAAHWCASVFGPDTPAADDCTSQAAHGTGPFYECGPGNTGGGRVLCGQVCCAAGQVCANGQCVSPCSATTCPNGCCDASGTCQANAPETCGTNGASCITCGSGQTCTGGRCCVPNGGFSGGSGTSCLAEACCSLGCLNASGICCVQPTSPCASDSDCCYGRPCVSGLCT